MVGGGAGVVCWVWVGGSAAAGRAALGVCSGGWPLGGGAVSQHGTHGVAAHPLPPAAAAPVTPGTPPSLPGFIPRTYCPDHDPLDILVLMQVCGGAEWWCACGLMCVCVWEGVVLRNAL